MIVSEIFFIIYQWWWGEFGLLLLVLVVVVVVVVGGEFGWGFVDHALLNNAYINYGNEGGWDRRRSGCPIAPGTFVCKRVGDGAERDCHLESSIYQSNGMAWSSIDHNSSSKFKNLFSLLFSHIQTTTMSTIMMMMRGGEGKNR